MTSRRKAVTNVTLEDQLSYKDKLPKGQSYFENNALFLMGETSDHLISVVSCIFRAGGGLTGPWQVDDVYKLQTTFVVEPKGQTDKMHDNEFIGNRTWATDHWRGGGVRQTKDEVVWYLQNREIVCRPPYWEMKGEHLGVECDLVFGGLGDASYHKGKYADLAKNGLAGYEQPMWVEGSIKAQGKTYTLTKGFGVQEKFTQPAWDLAQVLTGTPYYWCWWASDNIRIFIYYFPSMGRTYSHVVVDEKEVVFHDEKGSSNIILDELEYWIDPKTRMQVPVKWHFNLASKNGVIDLHVAASSRTYYGYLTKSGPTIHYGLHAHSKGQLFLSDGRVIPLNNMMTYMENGWCAIPLPSGAA
ncbi:MAG: hypothetical protein PHV74_06040 [Dehalococcoidia bacterium]|nr:hypothetical protein [Dehalococcoidia bacterium]